MIKVNFISRELFIYVCLLLFIALTSAGIFYHELWIDEAHHWLLSRDSKSLQELWNNTRYEGHPLLWNLILFFISACTVNPMGMQIAHGLIAAISVFLFLKFSPFSTAHKVLFIFGYFILYEYTVISRNYALIVLLLFGLLSLIPNWKKWPIVTATLFFFLANTHLFGLILVFWFVVVLLLNDARYSDISAAKKVIGLSILASGLALSVYQIYPPADSPFHPDLGVLLSFKSLERISSAFIKSFLPVPIPEYHFWNTNLLISVSKLLAGILSIAVILLTLFSLADKQKSLLLFICFSASLIIITILFIPVSIVQAVRHFGILYIAYIGCLWLGYFEAGTSITIFSSLKGSSFYRYKHYIVSFFLMVQTLAGVIAYYKDLKNPFSESKNAAEYIKGHYPKGQPVAGELCFSTASLSAYLENEIFSFRQNEWQSFCRWNIELRPDPHDVEERALEFAQQLNKPALLLSYDSLKPNAAKAHHFIFVKSFQQSIVPSENFFLYEVHP